MRFLPWADAWHQALYGERGFYRCNQPVEHFRTSVHASPLLATALAGLASDCGLSRVVDVGSGRGELLSALARADPGLRLVGVDVVPRPPGLPPSARWLVSPGGRHLPPGLGGELCGALVLAHEWLDDVPCPVLELDAGGRLRVVEVDPGTGDERLGGDPPAEQLAWAQRWWPVEGLEAGDRVEVGLPRDQAWAELVRAASAGVLLAVDYAHDRSARPPSGSLLGYRHGTACAPVPDGSCDVTAHVALDSASAAGERAGATSSLLTTQRAALLALGVDGARPDPGLARSDPAGYLGRLVRAGEAAELLAPGGLGSFGWLVCSRGPTLPPALAAALCPPR